MSIELHRVADLVNDFYKVDLLTRSRKRQYLDSRCMFYKLSREYVDRCSLQELANFVGLNHASVISALKVADNLLWSDKQFEDNYITLKKTLDFIMANPYEKYLGKEDMMQHEIMNYIKKHYPDVLAIHVPNESKRSTFERYKFKMLGGMSGIPDVLIFRANKEFYGLAMELKVGYNKPTENQLKCLDLLKKENWKVCWLNDYEKAIDIINEYLSK